MSPRDPAAKRRVLKRLRKVPQGQPVLAQLLFQHRPGGAGLDPRRQRLRIDLQHPVQSPQVERDNRPIPDPRLNPPNHTRPAAERHHSRPGGLTPSQHRLDLRLVLGEGDQIRRVGKFPPKPPHHIPIRLPQSPRNPLIAIIGKQIPKLSRHLQPRRPKLNLLQRNRRLRLPAKPQPLSNPGSSLPKLPLRRRLILITPPPVLKPSLRAHKQFTKATLRGRPYQCTPFIRCAKATASVEGGLSGASSVLPLAA